MDKQHAVINYEASTDQHKVKDLGSLNGVRTHKHAKQRDTRRELEQLEAEGRTGEGERTEREKGHLMDDTQTGQIRETTDENQNRSEENRSRGRKGGN